MHHDGAGGRTALGFGNDTGHGAALGWLMGHLREAAAGVDLLAAGHRVVHGGRDFAAPARIACFDAAFQRSQTRLEQLYALARALTDAGVLRYGFHGLSYDYVAGRLPGLVGARAGGRVAVLHLGNGASICGMKRRRSVATSMGFAALDGLMMGRRCGDIDPGVVLYLMRDRGLSLAETEALPGE